MGISLWQLLIILLIVLLLFGTKKLRSIGSDLGGAVKGFRSAMDKEEEGKASRTEELEHGDSGRVIEGEVTREDREKDKDKV